MSADFRCTITDPERRRDWMLWIGTDTVCVRHPLPVAVEVAGLGMRAAYILDADELNEGQRLRLVRGIAQKFGAPLSDVVQQMMGTGIAILAEHCTVELRHPERWFC